VAARPPGGPPVRPLPDRPLPDRPLPDLRLTDRRLTPMTARVAHESLRGRAGGRRLVAGTPARVALPLADLRRAPGGPRDRQVLLGERLVVLDHLDGHAFVQADKDGYCGWVEVAALGPDAAVSHWVSAPASHLYPAPRVQAEAVAAVPFGALVAAGAAEGGFAPTPAGWLPAAHLRPLAERFDDAAAVALLFLGTPYLWGGNSRAGIDCSGLIQAALLACGRPCPGDSDLQATLGRALAPDEAAVRGDLIFWAGHVAMVVAPGEIVHATGHGMTTRTEPLEAAIARIAAAGGGPVTGRRRP
jgi:cell wall-associated NlpC family hydrolase